MAKIKRIALQNRDFEIIKLVGELGYMNTSLLIEHGLFKTKSVAAKRLAMLKRAGYFGAYYRVSGTSANLIYYPISEKYRGTLDKEYYFRALKTAHFKPWRNKNARHEDILRSWALRFYRLFPGAFIDLDFMGYCNKEFGNEHLRYRQKNLPDMIIEIEDLDYIYIEIELTQKTNARYENKILGALSDQKCQIFYLTDSPAIKRSVEKMAEEIFISKRISNPLFQNSVHVFLFSELNDDAIFRNTILTLGTQKVVRALAGVPQA